MSKFPAIQKSNNKVNYYQQSLNEIDEIKRKGYRPKLLLHACCAPCATFPLEFLSEVFNCTLLYNNSNIYPSDEYNRRLNELKNYLEKINSTNSHPIQLVEVPYNNEEYTKKLEPLKDYPEGSMRCITCYTLRMHEAYQYAANHQFDYFTTVMTISRQKDSQKLNEIGSKLQAQFPTVKYFYSDFKKKQGIDRGRELSMQYNLYRQQYCGCIFSYQEYLKRKV